MGTCFQQEHHHHGIKYMPATTVSDKFLSSAPLWAGAVGSGGVPDASVATVPLASPTGLEDGQVYVFSVDRVDLNKVKTPAKREVCIGKLSGDNLIDCVRGVEGTAQEHNAGAVVEILFTHTHWKKLIEGLEVQHNQDGTHKDITADSIVVPSIIWGGWQRDNATWTRTGNHTFTVAGDRTAEFRKGTKIRYKDGGAFEYGVVASSSYSAPNTTVTLITNTDFTMAATTITDTWVSYIESPEGFPVKFNVVAPVFDTNTVDNGTNGVQPGVTYSHIYIYRDTIKHEVKINPARKKGTGKFLTMTIPVGLPVITQDSHQALGTVVFATLDRNGVARRRAASAFDMLWFAETDITDTQTLTASTISYTYNF